MGKISKALLMVLGLSFFTPALGHAQSFDARSVGMGGIGASTAKYYTAPFHNPALGAKYDESDDYAILFPSLGINYHDPDDLVNTAQDLYDSIKDLEKKVDSINSTYATSMDDVFNSFDATKLSNPSFDSLSDSTKQILTDLSTNLSANPNLSDIVSVLADNTSVINEIANLTAEQLSDLGIASTDIDTTMQALGDIDTAYNEAMVVIRDLNKVKSSRANINIGTGITGSIATKFMTVTPFVKGQLDAIVLTDINEEDLKLENLIKGSAYNYQSIATASGALVMDYGVSLAKSWEIADRGTLYVGVSPKIQTVYTINYTATVNNYDFDDFDYHDYMNSTNTINADLGLAYTMKQGFTFGLVGKNLISRNYRTETVNGTDAVYTVNPVFTASASYANSFMTLGVDLDLNKSKRFTEYGAINNPVDTGNDDLQMLGFGAEFDAFKWMQVRAGYKIDLQNNMDDEFTLGLGFSPFNLVHIDIAGSYAGDNQFGVALQLAYTF